MPPRKVLFVEDETALQYSYERFFQGKYSMAYAPSGAEAMRQYELSELAAAIDAAG